ncbi:hypothetical protein ALC57_00996 [Trachymyrmex cornetzi]|uniref:DUF8207 domain-containing protein n=1 Tax=Trachymyrmex cornetzi TaxID=471704 RepID=A0A151JQN7_9HYME|nr:hypothetical protein ALC57_00996 [Trachymyrmex cornetzi]
MDNSKDREKVAKEIAKTSDSIRKKYRALKTGKMDEDIVLERHFKPIIDPLKQIVENTTDSFKNPIMTETIFSGEDEEPKAKRKRPSALYDNPIQASTPVKSVLNRAKTVPPALNEMSEIPHIYPIYRKVVNKLWSVKTEIYESGPEGKKAVNIDVVYGVYFSDEGTMLGDKRITLHKNDDIIIDGKRYDGTAGLYELIFMKFPNESICTDDDVHTYRSILLTTNAPRRGHSPSNQVMGSKGYKYKNMIAPLVWDKKVGTGINKRADLPRTMTLNDNKIDYIHWDDPNEIVDSLRLLEALRQAGHNGHDNEILSIIEELREAGLIINEPRSTHIV